LSFFQGADHLGNVEGEPPANPVYRGESLLGYVFQTVDIAPIPAYSGKPVNVLVGVGLDGNIVGLKILEHEEPILIVGVSEQDLADYLDQYRGRTVHDRIKLGGRERTGYVRLDGISGASITAMVMNASVNKAIRKIAVSRGIPSHAPVSGSDITPGKPGPSWWFGATAEPFWVTIWRERLWQVVILCTALVILTFVLLFQDGLARQPGQLEKIRNAFLIFTLVFIGWYTLAQLSIVHVLTFVSAVLHEFNWESFLVDPLIFILWGFVALTLLLWGRGVYCGWLCPFGALQELVSKVANRFNLKQFHFPDVVHERLVAVKYVIFVALFGLSLQSIGHAAKAAEIEPFKTAIVMHFQREWWFVVYAGALIVMSAFHHKFFCKYLCPLGAALAIPAPLRIFDWLRRRKECGRPCQICAVQCDVGAIRSTGEINASECHYCLDCQVIYYSDHECPPLAKKRKRREERGEPGCPGSGEGSPGGTGQPFCGRGAAGQQ
jgi:hypothetical protein